MAADQIKNVAININFITSCLSGSLCYTFEGKNEPLLVVNFSYNVNRLAIKIF